MKVNFSFPQTLQTAFPGKEIEIFFAGEAVISDTETVRICGVSLDGEPLTIPILFQSQNLATGEMGEFLGKCREAARNAYYKERMKEAAIQHNAGFVPMASDISYMEESDRFPDVTIDRS